MKTNKNTVDRHVVGLVVFLIIASIAYVVLSSMSGLFHRGAAPLHEALTVDGTAVVTLGIVLLAYWRHRQEVSRGIASLNVALHDSEQSIFRLSKEAVETNQIMEQVSVHFNELFQRIPAPCFCYDSDGHFKEWNRAFEHLTLLDPAKIINEPVSKFVSVDADPSKMQALMSAVFHGDSFEGIELQTLSAAGGCKTILCNMFPLRGEGGTVTAAICAGIDISERIRLEMRMLKHVEMLSAAQLKLEEQQLELVTANAKLELLAMSDSLTGLANHRALQERLAAEFKRSKRYGSSLSVLLIDVDRFKKYNDSYGHLAGDQVLQGVAELLSSSMRDTDFVARYGGEEFVVVLPHADYLGSLEAAERLRSAVEQAPWDLIRVTVSIGISTLSSEKTHYSDLIAQSDLALYYCKQHGRNQVMHVQDLPSAQHVAAAMSPDALIDTDDRPSIAI